jgi:hypothetical protein
MMSDYMSGDQRPGPLDVSRGTGFDVQTTRNDVVFKNGAVYRG